MVMKNAAWGEIYSDGRCKHYGWTNPASYSVKIADPNIVRSRLTLLTKVVNTLMSFQLLVRNALQKCT